MDPITQAFTDAELLQAQSIGAPGTLVINSVKYPARVFTARGTAFSAQGGALQTRKLSATVLTSVLPSSVILDGSGNTRPVELTHFETGLGYRINTDGVNNSPYGVFWSLECTQPTAK